MVTILLNFVSPPTEEYEAGLLRSQLFDTMPLEGGTMLTANCKRCGGDFPAAYVTILCQHSNPRLVDVLFFYLHRRQPLHMNGRFFLFLKRSHELVWNT